VRRALAPSLGTTERLGFEPRCARTSTSGGTSDRLVGDVLGQHEERDRDGADHIGQGLDIYDFSRARIDASPAELAEERDAVTELGLI
jgi:hypothetical protein